MKVTGNYIEAKGVRAPFARHDAAMDIVHVELAPMWADFIAALSPGTEAVLANSGGDQFTARVVTADPVRLSVTVELT